MPIPDAKVPWPIVECDPWREQYFPNVSCPPDVVVPTDYVEAYRLVPEHRWVYNKLRTCETQGIEHAPHGIRGPRGGARGAERAGARVSAHAATWAYGARARGSGCTGVIRVSKDR